MKSSKKKSAGLGSGKKSSPAKPKRYWNSPFFCLSALRAAVLAVKLLSACCVENREGAVLSRRAAIEVRALRQSELNCNS
jgi:hypothetical protein